MAIEIRQSRQQLRQRKRRQAHLQNGQKHSNSGSACRSGRDIRQGVMAASTMAAAHDL